MSGLILLDTNILVDLFRKSPAAVAFIAELRSRPAVSAITVAELFAGVRDGRERSEVEDFLTRTILLEVDERIAVRAGLMVRQYRKSHGVGLADAIIAATAEVEDARLATLNVKHFPMLPDVLMPYVRQ